MFNDLIGSTYKLIRQSRKIEIIKEDFLVFETYIYLHIKLDMFRRLVFVIIERISKYQRTQNLAWVTFHLYMGRERGLLFFN